MCLWLSNTKLVMNRKILIFGGTNYFGKHLVNQLLANGDRVYIATRGNKPVPSGCDFIPFDRDGNALFNVKHHWDVVYDQSCYKEAQLINILPVIARCSTYVLTSSQAVYPSGLAMGEKITASTDSLVNSYGLEKRKSERFIQSQTADYICPRFPVVVGENDSLRRLQQLIETIHAGTVTLPRNNPLLQLLDEYDAAKVLFELPLQDFRGAINIASPGSISTQQLCEFLAQFLSINLNIEWSDHYHHEPFDLIKATSKTLCLQRQEKLGLKLKDLSEILHDFSLYFCKNL